MADFHKSLAEFRELTQGIKAHGNLKKFKNLREFQDYYKDNPDYRTNRYYRKKTDKDYKKSNIPSKIPFKREENPKEWMKQYGWFRNNPEATVYDPKPYDEFNREHTKNGRSETSKKIKFKRCENPKEYDKQYHWFKRNPEATVYEPKPPKHPPLKTEKNPLVTVTRKQDYVEYNRQHAWLSTHRGENPTKIPPRERQTHTKKKS
jgi:hypothetical protein